MNAASSLEDIVREIQRLRTILAELRKSRPPEPPAGPAATAAIESVAHRFGFELPDDYREFLTRHDGWPRFSGDNDMLSTADILSGRTAEWVAGLQSLHAGKRVAHGRVIMASPLTKTLLFFAPASERGRLEVIYWHDEEIGTYESFTAFLTSWISILERRIADERRRLRPPATGGLPT